MEGERELYKEDIGGVNNGYRPRRIYTSVNMMNYEYQGTVRVALCE
ncbi:hypothetical protein QYZ87_05300 [Porphyromonadaceae bacterium W3.11]|nr:hypothetical protein [Porphyromonadaceae bacterium W3.11]